MAQNSKDYLRATDGGVSGARLCVSNGRPVLKEGCAATGGEHAEAAAIHSGTGPGVATKAKDGNNCGGNLQEHIPFDFGF